MKSLKKFSNKIAHDLVKNLIHFHAHQDSETLHEIRVDIKRMKAVLNAVQFHQHKFKAHRAFLPFRDIFRKAGAIREPEVLQKILPTQPDSTKKGKVETDTVKAFTDEVPLFILNILRPWMENESFISKVSRKELRVYVDYLIKRVQKELSHQLKMDTIHKTRKAIKEIVYLSKVTHNLSNNDRDFYSRMEELIGQWHDKHVLLSGIAKHNGVTQSKLSQLKSASEKDKRSIKELAETYYG